MRFLTTRLFDWLNQVDGAQVEPKTPMIFCAACAFTAVRRDRQITD